MPFGYWRDPLFVGVVVLYFINRFVLKPFLPNVVSEGYVNDLICIPFWVPIMVWGMRRVGWRDDDDPPRIEEVVIPLIVWAAVFELWLPRTAVFAGVAVNDPVDIVCYAAGALGAMVFWGWWYDGR